jgi:hypothetical protein
VPLAPVGSFIDPACIQSWHDSIGNAGSSMTIKRKPLGRRIAELRGVCAETWQNAAWPNVTDVKAIKVILDTMRANAFLRREL